MENPAQPQLTPPQKPNRNWKKILLFLLIGLFLISLVGVGLYLLIPKPSEEPTTQPQKQATPSAKTTTPSAKKDETADWKTLISETIASNPEIFDPTKTINFSFKYPDDFYKVKDSEVALVTNDPSYQLSVKTPGKIAAWARISDPLFEVSSSSDSSLGGVGALRKLGNRVVLYHISSIKTKEGVAVSFVFQCTYLEKEDVDTVKTCDLMASTFKFLD